jgi:hypothetical protein
MSAKVVYGLGTPQGTIRVLDLSAGTTKSIAGYYLGSNAYGSCCFRWSPSGKRIMVQNFDSVNVLNEDGSNMKLIARDTLCGDMIWGDWRDDSTVVYSTGKKVVQTAVHTNNSPGATAVLVNDAAVGCGYTSVGIDGDWLSYIDWEGNVNSGGWHRSLLKNLRTGVVTKLDADTQDMCQLTMIPDPARQYKTLGQMNSHLVPGTICDTNGNHIATLPQIGVYPQRAYSWSNQLEYFMCQGENSTNTWAWIRSWSKRTTSANIIVSDTGSMVMYYPDLYVTPTAATLPGFSIGQAEIPRRIDMASFANIKNARFSVYTISGSKVDAGTMRALPPGIYLVKVPGAAAQVRFMTVK